MVIEEYLFIIMADNFVPRIFVILKQMKLLHEFYKNMTQSPIELKQLWRNI